MILLSEEGAHGVSSRLRAFTALVTFSHISQLLVWASVVRNPTVTFH